MIADVTAFLRKLAIPRFQLKFKDRYCAGKLLGDILNSELKGHRDGRIGDLIVLGIPRGGIVTACAVASKISCELGITISRRIVAPHNQELSIGAVAQDGTSYINQELMAALSIPNEYVEKEKARLHEDVREMVSRYGPGIPAKNFAQHVLVLIDDGSATGSTLIAAVRYLRKHNPRQIVVGVPVATRGTAKLLSNEADTVQCIVKSEDNRFSSVEQFYDNFQEVSDLQVQCLLWQCNP